MTHDPKTLRALALQARHGQRALGAAPAADRTAALETLASLLDARREALLAANREDLARAERDGLSGVLLARLGLSHGKLDAMIDGVRQLAATPDPLGRTQRATQLDDGLILRQVSHALGVLLIIFESRPDAVIQIGSLAIRSANAVILKGGREASASNRALAGCLRDALAAATGSADAVQLIEGREAIAHLLTLDDCIDLVIPRGSAQLVRSIQDATRIAVLGHADGICHVYLDAVADPQMAVRIAIDAKTDYPSACNAMETLLVHEAFLPHLPDVLGALAEAGVRLRGDTRCRAVAGRDMILATQADWSTEYGDLDLSVRCVASLEEAVDHIHRYGSGHTDAIVTADQAAADTFLRTIDSASVFVNASTRFADGYRYGLGAEVGISTSRLHARGPVGIDGLLTTRWLLRGDGQVAADFNEQGHRRFQHRPLPVDGPAGR
ncbi:MAG: glutamate-5-semialdehyde dehydrogenase [Pseudomonadota bacterium]